MVDQSELGRRSVAARRKAREAAKAGGQERIRAALRRRLEADPDAVVERLMAGGAKGIEVLWTIGYREAPAKPKDEGEDDVGEVSAAVEGLRTVTLEDMLVVLRETGQIACLPSFARAVVEPMIPLLDASELEAVLGAMAVEHAGEAGAAPEIVGVPFPPRTTTGFTLKSGSVT